MISKKEFNRGKDRKKIKCNYIAYGSNMDLNQMSYRVKDSILIGTGYLENYRLEFKSRYATIEEEESKRVPVVIFGISEEDEIRLDRYEGYPELYYKKYVRVKMNETGEEVECMVYIMEEEYNKYQLPNVEYYLNMEESYKRYRFKKDILESALIKCYKGMGRKETYNLIVTDELNSNILESYISEDLEELGSIMEEGVLDELRDKSSYIRDKDNRILYYSRGGRIYNLQDKEKSHVVL